MLRQLVPECTLITLEHDTEGAACTVLLATAYIDGGEELVIANSDQLVDYDLNRFIEHARRSGADGSILTFEAVHPKWSYARVNDAGLVTQVAEKRVISNHATVGIYYFRRGSDFVQAATSMIRKELRINNEFYVCPVYNELILADRKIIAHEIPEGAMHGLGTPEDLEIYLSRTGPRT